MRPKKSEPIRAYPNLKIFCSAYWHSSPSADDNGIGQSENTYRQIVPNSTKLDQTRPNSTKLDQTRRSVAPPFQSALGNLQSKAPHAPTCCGRCGVSHKFG